MQDAAVLLVKISSRGHQTGIVYLISDHCLMVTFKYVALNVFASLSKPHI